MGSDLPHFEETSHRIFDWNVLFEKLDFYFNKLFSMERVLSGRDIEYRKRMEMRVEDLKTRFK